MQRKKLGDAKHGFLFEERLGGIESIWDDGVNPGLSTTSPYPDWNPAGVADFRSGDIDTLVFETARPALLDTAYLPVFAGSEATGSLAWEAMFSQFSDTVSEPYFGAPDLSRAMVKVAGGSSPKEATTDKVAPTLVSSSVDANATGVDPNLVLTFSESIAAGTGKIVLKGGGQTVEIPITDFNQVSISGLTLRIDPSVSLLPNTDYTVTLASGVIKDLAGNTFAGGTTTVSLSSLATAAAATWTVMIYMAADNDLESFALSDLNELEAAYTARFGEYDYNFVVMADRSPGYSTASGNWTDTRIGAIKYDASTVVVSPLNPVGELNTGDPGTLAKFVSWATGEGWADYVATSGSWGAAGQYAADNYGLVIWNHGSGLDGIAWDYTSNDHLTMPELSTAIDNSGVHFDFIGFDACLMSMAEIVYDLSDNADFIIGSQDLEPGNGWAYDDWLRSIDNQLAASPNAGVTAADMSSGIVNTFAAEYPTMKGIALSAVESAEMPTLINALSAFTSKVVGPTGSALASSNDIQIMTTAAQFALEFGSGKDEFIDLGQFMTQVAAKASDTGIRTAAREVSLALDDAILWEAGTVGGATGLSIYLPAGNEVISTAYTGQELSFLARAVPLWDDFLTII